jgi:N-acyl amino acid synthase FeeM
MSVGHIGDFPGSGTLNERTFDVMDNIEYRRVTAIEDFEAIGRLRAQAFDARFIYPKKMANSAVDEMDFTPNAYVYGMYYLGELVSTVRIHVVSRKNPQSVSARLFPNTLKPLIDQGMTFIDSTRFAVDEEISHSVPGLPLLTLRIPMMAMTYFNADTGLALIKEGHAPFYRRVFRATLLAGPEQFDTFAFPAVLFQSPHANTPDTCRRYPMFYSTAAERRMMFDKSSRKAPPLTILPTAKLVEWAA